MKPTIDLVPAKLGKYCGMRFYTDDQFQRADQMSFTLATECLAAPNTPFGRICRNGLLLNDETREYLYGGDFGKIETPYRKGTYPLLERYIDSLVTSGMDDAEKVIALSQSLKYDVPRQFLPPPGLFLYGESDEQTLLKGAGHCSCMARLVCTFCQMLGIPARPVLLWTWHDRGPGKDRTQLQGGHTVAEVFLGGKWGFFDPMLHQYCRTAAGTFPSIDEIRRRPELFTKMPKAMVSRMRPATYPDMEDRDIFEWYWYKNFSQRRTVQVSRHDAMAKYEGGWVWADDDFRKRQQSDMRRSRLLLEGLAEKGEITDEIYRMNLKEFRARFGITQIGLESPADTDHAGKPIKKSAAGKGGKKRVAVGAA